MTSLNSASNINKMKPIYDYIIKFIIVGDANVGKSNLLLQFTDKTFLFGYDITIGVDFATKIVTHNNKVYKIQLWDTAGQELFRAITRSHYRNVSGCIIVYDITNKKSFESIDYWINDLRDQNQNISIVIIGNKTDLNHLRMISIDDGIKKAEEYKIKIFETSAKLCSNVDEAFLYLVNDIDKKIESGEIIIEKAENLIQLVKESEPSYCSC